MTKQEKINVVIVLIFSLILLVIICFMLIRIYNGIIADYCSRLPITDSINSPICEDYWNKYELED